MHMAIVKASQIGTECWSALRFVQGGCAACRRVAHCPLKEAQVGRVDKFRGETEWLMREAVTRFASAMAMYAKNKKRLAEMEATIHVRDES